MKKNRTRLTESQLHQVIKESVKQILSELDWKTYQNASNVAREKGEKWNDVFGDNPRAKKFRAAAKKQFAKEKGYDYWDKRAYERIPDDPTKNGKYYWEKYTIPRDDSEYPTPTFAGGDGVASWSTTYDGDHVITRRNTKYYPGEYGYDKYFDDEIYPRTIPRTKTDIKWTPLIYDSPDNKSDVKLYNDAAEVNNFKKGKYEYQHGKGWHLKDGLDESIRKAIRKALR